jgi:hypothetical protein
MLNLKKGWRKIILSDRKVAFEEIESTAEYDVVKILTEDPHAGVDAEYDWLDFRYPNADTTKQTLSKRVIRGKSVTCDILSIILEDGTEREVIFDISLFFGKKHRKTEAYSGNEYCDISALSEEIKRLIAEFEHSEDDDLSPADYIKNIEEIIAKKKISHAAYLEKLEPLALNNPEYPALMKKYAWELVASMEQHDDFYKGKAHLDCVKNIMDENPGEQEFIVVYSWALHYFSLFFGCMEPRDLQTEEKIVESIYSLWREHPCVFDLLKTYVAGLKFLHLYHKDDIEKARIAANINRLADEYPDVVKKFDPDRKLPEFDTDAEFEKPELTGE